MSGGRVADVERSLERLFRLSSGRGLEGRQTEVVGADVTRAGYAILRCLADAGDQPFGDVARECSMDPGAASRQVRQLEAAGLVERAAAAGDGRVAILRLTARGRDVYRRIVQFRTGHMQRVLDGWPAAERTELVRLVDRLVDDLRSTPLPEGASNAAQ